MPNAISKLLKGTQIPRVDTMVKLEDALGLKRATLIEGIAGTRHQP